MKRIWLGLAVVAGLGIALLVLYWWQMRPAVWSDADRAVLKSLSLAALGPLPADKSNRVADDPRAVALGHHLYFDARFSVNGKVACNSCHMPEQDFRDARPRGMGIAATRRRTQSIVGTAYLAWFYWDGRKDSQWSQALAPLEHPNEQGGDRTQYAHLIGQFYRTEYEDLFGALPPLAELPARAGPHGDAAARQAWDGMTRDERQAVSTVFANLGKAIAAYERTILPGRSRFDDYVDALARNGYTRQGGGLSSDEVAGLELFIGKAGCVKCHSGPLFTDDEFHNTGVPQYEAENDLGRAEGTVQNFEDEFKCWSEYSDDPKRDCPALRYMVARDAALVGAFKTPSLRGARFVPPFMHNGRYSTLREVIDHYDAAPAAMAGESELMPLHLTEREKTQLEAFLHTLSAPLNTPAALLQNPFELK